VVADQNPSRQPVDVNARISISQPHEYQAAGRTAVPSENYRAGILDDDSGFDPLRQIALRSEPSGASRPEDITVCHNRLRSGEPQ
jgi:hypothetical protein